MGSLHPGQRPAPARDRQCIILMAETALGWSSAEIRDALANSIICSPSLRINDLLAVRSTCKLWFSLINELPELVLNPPPVGQQRTPQHLFPLLRKTKSVSLARFRFSQDHRGCFEQVLAALESSSHLSSVTLSDGGLSLTHLGPTLRVLSCSTSLTRLIFRGGSFELGLRGCRELAQMLQKSTKLIELDISSNCTGNLGMEKLVEALAAHPALTSFDCSESRLDQDGVPKLAALFSKSSTLRILRMSQNNVGPRAAREIARLISLNPSLKELDISMCLLSHATFALLCSGLAQNSRLDTLICGSNRIGESGLSELATVLARNTALTKLDLQAVGAGVAALTHLETALASNTTLTWLSLSRNAAPSDVAAEILARLMRRNLSLRYLDLSACALREAAFVSLCEGILLHPELQELDLSFNSSDRVAAESIVQLLSATGGRRLRVGLNSCFAPDNLALIEQAAARQYLVIVDTNSDRESEG